MTDWMNELIKQNQILTFKDKTRYLKGRAIKLLIFRFFTFLFRRLLLNCACRLSGDVVCVLVNTGYLGHRHHYHCRLGGRSISKRGWPRRFAIDEIHLPDQTLSHLQPTNDKSLQPGVRWWSCLLYYGVWGETWDFRKWYHVSMKSSWRP